MWRAMQSEGEGFAQTPPGGAISPVLEVRRTDTLVICRTRSNSRHPSSGSAGQVAGLMLVRRQPGSVE